MASEEKEKRENYRKYRKEDKKQTEDDDVKYSSKRLYERYNKCHE